LWPHPEKSREFICRNCQRIRRLKKEKSFESDFRRFRERQDYVSPEETFQTNQSRISDDEFDEIITGQTYPQENRRRIRDILNRCSKESFGREVKTSTEKIMKKHNKRLTNRTLQFTTVC
jgi:hypothetical protein